MTAFSSLPNRPSKRCKGRSGFSILELLVVMSIMAIIIGSIATVATNFGKEKSVENAVNILRSELQNARTIARGRGVHTRVLILNKFDNNYNGAERYRNYIVTVVSEKLPNSNSYQWKPLGNGISLPKGVRFSTEHSAGFVNLDQQSQIRANGNLVPVEAPILGSKFGNINSGDWISYGFDTSGAPINSPVSDRLDLILQANTGIDETGDLQIREKYKNQVGGMALTRSGNVLLYRDAAHIETITGGDFVD